MKFLPRLSLCFLLGLLLTGCFESRLEVEVRKDGSAALKGSLHLSERMVMAIETAEASDSPQASTSVSVPFHEASFREQLGDQVEVISLDVQDLEDGSRKLTYELEVPDLVAFLQENDEDLLSQFRFEKQGEDQGVLIWDGGAQEGALTPELGVLYGMVKGLYMELQVTLPVSLSSETADLSRDGRTLIWRYDLRDRTGLARAVEIQEASGENPVIASFPLSSWPEIADRLAGGSATAEGGGTVHEELENDGSLFAQVAAVHLRRKHQLIPEEEMKGTMFYSPEKEELSVEVLLTWSEGAQPKSYGQPVLEEIITETGESLLQENRHHNSFTRDVHERMTAAMGTVKVNAPSSPVAKSLRIVKGHVPVVAGIETRTVVVENPAAKLGEGALEDETLREFQAVLNEVDGSELEIEIQGEVIESIELIQADGTRLRPNSRSWSGGNSTYTYTYGFKDSIGAEDSIELELRISERSVKVPFHAREIRLP